ncbi:hypothetical protein SEPCBS119000_003525 [Sporothrix epigloea]|uniref:Xaa-Pro aminopeptidase n=1 Tax=Sporothrix epigloea TaxID=1892477 RepID=A0ABP0DP28_9PEZI
MSRNKAQPTLPVVDHDLIFVEEFDALAIELRMDPETEISSFDIVQATNPQNKYPAKLHAQKVAKELGVKEGLIYLPGLPTQLYEDSDMGPELRQRRYFYYIAGADFDNCAVTYDLASDSLVLWVPFIDPHQLLWYGTSPGPKECLATTDLDDVRYIQDLDAFLRKRLALSDANASEVIRVGASIGSNFCCDRSSRNGWTSSSSNKNWSSSQSAPSTTLFVLHPDQIPSVLRDGGDADAAVTVDSTRLLPAMNAARVIKTPYEIDLIRKANDISSAAHTAVLRRLKGMTNEQDIEAAFLDHCLAVYGAKHQSYHVIAGSGPNSSVLHYDANNESLAGRQLVCLDAGAEWKLYASDVTRTFPISGKFTPEAAAIYAAVQRMQTEVFARFKPGAAFANLHLHAGYVAAQELLGLGILKNGSAMEILAKGTVSAFFPHGLGHHVGLEVHDVLSSDLMSRPPSDAANSSKASSTRTRHIRSQLGGMKRQPVTADMYATLLSEAAASANDSVTFKKDDKRRLLEPGMIITVEPGIYFCRSYIESFFLADPVHAKYIDKDVLEKYYDVGGVRIEDCLLVTETGHDNLTTAPKGEEALHIINAGK